MSAAIFSNPVIWIVLAAVAAVVIIVSMVKTGERRRRDRLAAQFGKPVKPPEERRDVSGYWQLRRKQVPHHVDDITWGDLEGPLSVAVPRLGADASARFGVGIRQPGGGRYAACRYDAD